MEKDLIQTIKIIVIALVLTMGVNYVFAWTGPTQTPPDGNTLGPIDTGVNTQLKEGRLSLDVLSVFNSVYVQDTLGIGDVTPDNGLKLDVNGQMGAGEYCDEKGLNCIEIADLYSYIASATVIDCTLDGVIVANGDSYMFYSKEFSLFCFLWDQVRTCNNGTLDGSDIYQYASCN